MRLSYSTDVRIYAKAIFELAQEDDSLERWKWFMDVIKVLPPEGWRWMDDPCISAAEKRNVFNELVVNFPRSEHLIKLLAERNKLSLLPGIADRYGELFFQKKNVLLVKFVTVQELSLGQQERLTQALRRTYQQEILVEYSIDTRIIGGAILHINGGVIDYSLKGALRGLRAHLGCG